MTAEVLIKRFADVRSIHGTVGRPGSFDFRFCSFETGAPGYDMEFSWGRFNDGYATPRHRHSFDQIRFGLDGEFELEKGLELRKDSCGYFPEGVRYGPQLQHGSCAILLLQFPGPSGDEFVNADRMFAARDELEKHGTFANGVYTWTDADSKVHNMDSHRACFEGATGREPIVPPGRYRGAVVVDGEALQWVAHPEFAGVREKYFGTFAEYRTGTAVQEFETGAVIPAHTQKDAEIRCLIGGSATYGGQTYTGGIGEEEAMFFYFPPGAEVEELKAGEGARFFVISLPFVRAFIENPKAERAVTPSQLPASLAA